MKKYFLLACAFCVFGVADAATIQFSSPDKKLQVTVADDGGRLLTVSFAVRPCSWNNLLWDC